ncbi:hypothetical protein B296_00031867 [Ensete ventricosum]|uniref:Uncharacterized protein n=1 Tax=Ensete ventricosum TaxID=4639 RepID=A0A426XCP8_ENSVE|nr:hypothetical protein B296_00031867 [Ensete ventricosum]
MRIGDCSYFDGELADELGERLFPSLGNAEDRLFTCQSCPRSESVEFDNKVSGSCGVCSSPRGVSPGSVSSLQYLSGVSVDCPASARSSYVGHVVATVPDTLPTTHCQEQCSLLPGALLASRLDMSALPCHQPPAVRGTIRWSVRHICSIMSPTTYCRGTVH